MKRDATVNLLKVNSTACVCSQQKMEVSKRRCDMQHKLRRTEPARIWRRTEKLRGKDIKSVSNARVNPCSDIKPALTQVSDTSCPCGLAAHPQRLACLTLRCCPVCSDLYCKRSICTKHPKTNAPELQQGLNDGASRHLREDIIIGRGRRRYYKLIRWRRAGWKSLWNLFLTIN